MHSRIWNIDEVTLLHSDYLPSMAASCGISSSLSMNFKIGIKVPGDVDNAFIVTGSRIRSFSSEKKLSTAATTSGGWSSKNAESHKYCFEP
jgi:hypothetical protein